MKLQNEWKIDVPWGQLVLLRWGRPGGDPVLLIHGRQDSSSVFIPLLQLMPDHYNYVALDMPGNGLSDPFPHGLKLMRLHFLAAMQLAVEHLGWNQFIFIGHSMGCEQGLFFNAVYPNRITKMVLLDAEPTMMKMQVEDPEEYQKMFYDSYYENYHKENFERKRYTKSSAVSTLKRLRGLDDAQAAHLLERNFHPIRAQDDTRVQNSIEARNLTEADNYKANNPNEAPTSDQRLQDDIDVTQQTDAVGYLSWDYRLKQLAPPNYGNDYYFQLFKTIPPTLLVAASEGSKNMRHSQKTREGAAQLVHRMVSEVKNFHKVDVEGGHDVHYTNPERVAPYVVKFLDENYNKNVSKLWIRVLFLPDCQRRVILILLCVSSSSPAYISPLLASPKKGVNAHNPHTGSTAAPPAEQFHYRTTTQPACPAWRLWALNPFLGEAHVQPSRVAWPGHVCRLPDVLWAN